MDSQGLNNRKLDDTTLREIFPIYLDDFLLDFSFEDIVSYVNKDYHIFTEEELYRIQNLPDEKHRIIQMFSILVDKFDQDNLIIQKFVNILNYDYNWIWKKIMKTNLEDKDILQYLSIVHDFKSSSPKHSDFNVTRLKYFTSLREELKKLKQRRYLVLYGELGIGKKWLAIDALCDYGVMKSMNYKIFWLDVHDCDSPQKDVITLQKLKILLGESNFHRKPSDYEGISNKILELQQDLRTILKKDEFKDCLLVLVNVKNSKTLEIFNLHCKILIITRNKAITEKLPSSSTVTMHVSEGLNAYECRTLFEKVLKPKKGYKSFPVNHMDLFEQSNGHPFLLNIIAQNLKDKTNNEWDKWIINLENLDIGKDNLKRVIKHSFGVLKEEEFELYKTLAIFNHSIKIPVKVLALFWKKSEKETETVLKKFDKFSLINIESKNGTKVCVIHFLYHSYLQDLVDANKKIELNKLLVKSFNIENALKNKTDLDLIDVPNRTYFYYYIGYHLKEAEMIHFFPKLYLNFIFLGQKLRITGLSNTIGDLNYFRKQITGNDDYKEDLIDELIKFLPNIEEMIYKSKDTCLLQYALMSRGSLRKEALSQAKTFGPDKIWFFDYREHFRKHRQMIQLPEKPKIVKLIDPDTCLIALENHIMFMADLSLGYCIEPTKFVGHSSKVVDLQIFNKNYLISCDVKGEVRIWSIADERRRSVANREKSIKRVLNEIKYLSNPRTREKECLQILTSSTREPKLRTHKFYIETTTENYDVNGNSRRVSVTYLYLVAGNGDIKFYQWNDNDCRFNELPVPSLRTETPNIRYLLKLFNRYFLILNNCGSLKIIKLSDNSSACFSFQWPQNTDSPVNIHSFYRGQIFYVIFVFTQQILQLALPAQTFEFINGELSVLYAINDRKNLIKCSALSEDNRYLIIGTKKGILLIDCIDKSELLRNSLSECIICVDICALNDGEIYKYIVVSGSEGQKVLNIYGLKLNGNDSIAWTKSTVTLCNDDDNNDNANSRWETEAVKIGTTAIPQFEPNTWLLGGKFFDVNFNNNNNTASLFAIDSKNRIHQLINNVWTMTLPSDITSNISSITAFNNDYYFGCENGDLYSSADEKIINLGSSIIFLKIFDSNIVIASTEKRSIVYFNANAKSYEYEISIVNCYKIFDQYLILLNRDCRFLILDLSNDCSILNKYDDCNDILTGSDFKSNTLVIATEKNIFYVYKFLVEDELKVIRYTWHKREAREENLIKVTTIALTYDSSLCAAGFDNGCIEVYKLVDKTWKLIQALESHKTSICDLKFSPWIDLNMPIILVSCAEQLCFWNITYILNNPLDEVNSYRRRSSRFSISTRQKSESLTSLNSNMSTTTTISSGSSSGTSSTAAAIANHSHSTPIKITNTLINHDQFSNIWLNKKGPSDKPELNSCIKFIGNKAEQLFTNSTFTEFITIDDEGEFYHLTVQNLFVNDVDNDNNTLMNNNNNDESLNDSAIGDDDVLI